ncbi:universal stress protein [Streptomyces sp. NPDC090057]|uniref:universal stress protein n=1 Tax=Streptomyces sp. NPDC090057 TaxID=3365935 RepID=UPI00382983E6
MPAPVIAGVDGSPESLAAAEWAAREAERRGRPLRLIHARQWHPAGPDGESVDAAGRRSASRVMDRAEERIHRAVPGVRVTGEQTAGPASAALLTAAGRAELLVLGSRGLTGLAGFLVGSVALGVVGQATGPVVLVRAGEDAAEEHLPDTGGGTSARTGYRDVVLALDVKDPCDEVVEFAFEAARLRRARLRAVHAWQSPPALGLGPGDIALVDGPGRADEWQGFVSAVLQVWRDKYADVEVLETVVRERPATALVRAASGASLLVVGRHLTGRPALVRTGPVTHAAIRHAGCPVAVVPHR